MRLGGQLRVASGMAVMVIGWDFNAAFALGDAMGISRTALAEFLPDLEQVMVRKLNEQADEGNG
ncbi:MAG: hypothetical protein GYB50_03925 [Rhodobacteraceae bacterium]|nr:hypothetical protein [Paracoccaceae bacterium]